MKTGEPYGIAAFLNYLHLSGGKNNTVHVAHYLEGDDVLRRSAPIYIDFYSLSLKKTEDYHPADENLSDSYLFFDGPEHPLEWNYDAPFSGFSILISSHLLSKHVKDYNFLHYNNHEALFLTHDEKNILLDLFQKAHAEYKKENFSREVIISYASLILSYTQIFYKRQFESRSKIYNKTVADFYTHLDEYFQKGKSFNTLPSVSHFAEKAYLSPNYFGDVIKHFTGISPQEHINRYLIQIAKQKLRQPQLSVSEIAYSLGFEYPTYFARFFRKQTGISPSHFRNQ